MSQLPLMDFSGGKWAFVPGPLDASAPFSSIDAQELADYSPEEIAAAVLAFPRMKLLNGNRPQWSDWRSVWESKDESVELNITLMGLSDEFWGGSEINALCHPETLIAIWQHLKANHPGIWLHDADCRMHTEKSFLESVASA